MSFEFRISFFEQKAIEPDGTLKLKREIGNYFLSFFMSSWVKQETLHGVRSCLHTEQGLMFISKDGVRNIFMLTNIGNSFAYTAERTFSLKYGDKGLKVKKKLKRQVLK